MPARKRYIVKLGEDGTLKIPASLLAELGVPPGSYVTITREGSGLFLRFRSKRVPLKLGRQVTTEEMERLIKEALDELVVARWET
ncbi:AbrB/MazE/SpoVT family DNA-binding domain-containing protein [Infirmifilum lucidum]|uniref:AbrB/MazE/SpoVT family DNA-binding domain-containing protein n=1 Tax=Infirmifilum lucidum TaxID=2776706 RepID=A0A7L9FI38_9CREN|nr:AbrB/MazE/SpoVT family DNA-binding domain-containing protein [Infirmifilum lucidum]QOJ78584.1 AbrB/MazE/SpoVT family DNA-binding domain-containing protein [Infirmifilum lucidum]